jgi:hypothetical protein
LESAGKTVLLVLFAKLLPYIPRFDKVVMVGPEIVDVELIVPLISNVYEGEVCRIPTAFDVIVIIGISLLEVPNNILCVEYLDAITTSSINEFENVSLLDATNSMKTALSAIILSLMQKK